MKPMLVLFTAITLCVAACKSSGSKDSKPSQDDPRKVAEAIFDAARGGDYNNLPALIADDADEDSKMIGKTATDTELQKEFKKHFSKGKVSGDPVIEGESASVPIMFGPDGDREETLNMVRKDGKWYLQSF